MKSTTWIILGSTLGIAALMCLLVFKPWASPSTTADPHSEFVSTHEPGPGEPSSPTRAREIVPARDGQPVPMKVRLPDGTEEERIVLRPSSKDQPKLSPVRPPDPIQLREHRRKGASFKCSMEMEVRGRGTKTGWVVVTGGAHFVYGVTLSWVSEVLENDGVVIREKRTYAGARACSVITVDELELTPVGTAAANLGIDALAVALTYFQVPVGGAATLSAREFIKGNVYDKVAAIPYFGDRLRIFLTRLARNSEEHQQIQAALRQLGRLEGSEAIVTWKDGRMVDVEWKDKGELMTKEDEDLASRVPVFAEFGLFPPEQKQVGEAWVIGADSIADHINLEREADSNVEGVVTLMRLKDRVPGVEAHVQGAGNASFLGDSMSGEIAIKNLEVRFVYAPEPNGKYCRELIGEGKLRIIKLPPTHLLSGVETRADPVVRFTYRSEPVAK